MRVGAERRPGDRVAPAVLDLVGRDDELHAIGDALDRHVREAVAVAALVGLVEALDQRGHRLGGDRLVAHLDERRLPALAEQAPVEAAARGDAVGGRADPLAQRALHLLVAVLDLRRAVGAQHHVGAAALVVDEVGAEQAHRREQAGVRRDHDARDLQQVERGGQEHRAGGAVGHEREVARVDAVAHGDVRDLLGDVGDGEAVGERHALLERERRLERLERAPRELGIQAHLAAGEAGRIEDAHQQAGVGQRRRRAAAPVARGPGVRARALGPDADVARRRDRHDAAAAGADARHLGRQRVDDQVVLDLEGVVDERRAVDDERDVGRGAADVGAQQVSGPSAAPRRVLEIVPGGRAREDDPKRLLQRLAPGQQRRRAVGEVQVALEAQLAQVGVEVRRVAPEDELHEDVDDRRRRARVLLGQRRGLRRDRDRDVVAQHLAGQLAQLLLVGRVDVGVEQADRHALHLAAAQHRELAARLVGVERRAARCRRRASARPRRGAGSAARAAGRRRRTSAARRGRSARRADGGSCRGRGCPGSPRW